MPKKYIIAGLFLLFMRDNLSCALDSTLEYPENDIIKDFDIHLKSEFDRENPESHFELINTRVQNFNLQLKLLEAKFIISENNILNHINELKNACNHNGKDYSSKDFSTFLKIIKQTQETINAELTELKSTNLLDMSNLYGSKEQRKNFENFMNLPKTCADATNPNLKDEVSKKDDAYLLYLPQANLQPFYAYCLHESPKYKSWTIIQRREDGSENFSRNWADYKRGFGNVYGEYWIGLERLYAMLTNQPHELWIFLRDFDDTTRYAKYSKFLIDNESKGYALTVDGYRGDAGDSLSSHNNMKFSTYDKNNNLGKSNCARSFKGGWWYIDCYFCHLNGVYYDFANKNTGNGIIWRGWLGANVSLKYAHMAIRPIFKVDGL